jgi:hypothetical protein
MVVTFFFGVLAGDNRQAEIIPIEPVRVMPEREYDTSDYPILLLIWFISNILRIVVEHPAS